METMEGLREFICVSENSSFSEAARSLKVSKSHISKQVTKLESSLQVRLFNRTTRKIALTKAGQVLYDRSRHIFSELGDIYNEVTQSQVQIAGSLKISVAGAFAEEYLSDTFSHFLIEHPKVKIELHFSQSFVDLIEGDYDIAIRYGKLNDSNLISKKIARRQELVCASPKYLAKHGTPKSPKDLIKHNCLVGSNDTWNFKGASLNSKVKVSGTLKSNNPRSIATAVKAGLGIARLPGAYTRDLIDKGELKELLKQYTSNEQDIWLVYPHKRFIPQSVRALIDYLSDDLVKNHKKTLF